MSAGELYRRLIIGVPLPKGYAEYYDRVKAALREAAADWPDAQKPDAIPFHEWFERWMAGIIPEKGGEDVRYIRQGSGNTERPACFGYPFSVEGCYDCAYFAACVLLKTAELFERDREMAGK